MRIAGWCCKPLALIEKDSLADQGFHWTRRDGPFNSGCRNETHRTTAWDRPGKFCLHVFYVSRFAFPHPQPPSSSILSTATTANPSSSVFQRQSLGEYCVNVRGWRTKLCRFANDSTRRPQRADSHATASTWGGAAKSRSPVLSGSDLTNQPPDLSKLASW